MYRNVTLILLLFVLMSAPASATLLYDNGSDPGTAAWAVSFGAWVSDSFVLSSGLQVGSVVFSNWYLNNGDVPTTIDWFVTTAVGPGNGITEGSGTANVTVLSSFVNSDGYVQAEVSVPLITIPSGLIGTFWLSLENEQFSNVNDFGYWGQSNGAASAQTSLGPLTGNCNLQNAIPSTPNPCGSESFQVFDSGGTSSGGGGGGGGGTPEPGTLALMGSGLLVLAGGLRRKVRA